MTDNAKNSGGERRSARRRCISSSASNCQRRAAAAGGGGWFFVAGGTGSAGHCSTGCCWFVHLDPEKKVFCEHRRPAGHRHARPTCSGSRRCTLLYGLFLLVGGVGLALRASVGRLAGDRRIGLFHPDRNFRTGAQHALDPEIIRTCSAIRKSAWPRARGERAHRLVSVTRTGTGSSGIIIT